MNIFPDITSVPAEDSQRLLDAGYLRSWNCLNAALTKLTPEAEDLKYLIILECSGKAPRKPILEKLIVRLQKREREALMVVIEDFISAQ